MDIGSAAQDTFATAAPGRPGVARRPAAAVSVHSPSIPPDVPRPEPSEDGRATPPERRLIAALRALDLPDGGGRLRMQLDYSRDTGRVVARVVDEGSGKVLRELPSKELQRLFAQMREHLGNVLDQKA